MHYALRLAAGFGSQIAMSLLRWTPMPDGRRRAPSELGYAYRIVDPAAWDRWLAERRALRRHSRGGPPPAADRRHRRPGRRARPAPIAAAARPRRSRRPPGCRRPPVAAAFAAARQRRRHPQALRRPAGAVDPLVAEVVGIVSEMTGYPPELLDVDLDLEADLGVDTVKQAEVFAAVRDKYGIERDDNVALRDFPTLRHVIGWVRGQTGIEPSPPSRAPRPRPLRQLLPQPQPPPRQHPRRRRRGHRRRVIGIVSEMTGYPAELLDLDLDLEADLGVDTVKQAEVFAAVRERFDVERDENLQLRDFPTLTHVIGWVRDKTGIQPATAAPHRRASSRRRGASTGRSAPAPRRRRGHRLRGSPSWPR